MNDSGKEGKCRWGENPKLQVFWFILVELQSQHFSNKVYFFFFFFLTGKQYEDETDLEVRSFLKWWVEGMWFWGSLVSFLKVANLRNYKCPSVIYGQVEILCITRSSEYFTPKFPCSASFPQVNHVDLF